MKKRILSLTLVMVMLLSTVPVPVYAENLGNGSAEAPWQIGDTVTNDGAAAPEGTTAENSYWKRTDVPAAATVVCQKEEHDHSVSGCEEIIASTDCLLEGHPTEGEETSFTHEDGTVCTYDAENNKWLTAMAAGFSCGLEAHTHTVEAGCIEESAAYTLWTLTENPAPAPDKLLASVPAPSAEGDSKTGLPVHFFLAAPGDITNPEGSYTNYYGPAGSGYNSWDGGESNLKVWDDWGVLYDQIGIRNVTDESIVTQYIASWPHGLSEAAFKNFGSVTIRVGWRNVTYTSDQYEIKWVNVMARNNADPDTALRCQQRNFEGDHIHVDGLLVEKIQPGEMQVFKAIPEAVESATTFQFTLEKLQQANLTVPPTSDAVDTSFPAMTLTATIPAGSTEAHVVGGSDISFGYYKLTENVNPNWVPNGITMTDGNNRTQTDNDANTLYIAIAPNGDVLYSTAVTGPYYTMSKVAMLNKRQNVNVT